MNLVPLKKASKIVGVCQSAIKWAVREKKLPVYRGKGNSMWFKHEDLVHWRDAKKKHRIGRDFMELPPAFTEDQWDALYRRVQIGWEGDGMDYHSLLQLKSTENEVSY